MKILLLGGSGRLGCAFRRQIKNHEIISPGHGQIDIVDEKSLARGFEEQPDLVINSAAYNNVDAAEGEGAQTCFLVNAYAPSLIAKFCSKFGVPLIQISSDYVFSGDKGEEYVENDQAFPINNYGRAKLMGEEAVLANHSQSYIVRTSRLFGPPGEFEGSKKSFVDIVLDLANKQSSFSINQAEVSSPTLVDDLARHIGEHILSLPKPGVYHISNSAGCTWYEWACEVVKILELPVEVNGRDPSDMPRPARRPAYSVLKSTKIPQMRSWQEALKDFCMGSGL